MAFQSLPPGFDVDVEISSNINPVFGEFRFEADGIEEDFTINGQSANTNFIVNETPDNSDTTYDVGTHGLIAWDGYQGLGVKTLIIDPNAEGIDLVTRSSGVVIERTRGDETIVIQRNELVKVCSFLKNDPRCSFEIMMDLTAVDRLEMGLKPRFEMDYHFKSLTHGKRLRLKTFLPDDDCRISSEQLLGEENKGFIYAMRGLDGGRLNIAAAALGGAQSALNIAKNYIKERKAFGKRLSDFQGLQFKVADMEIAINSSRIFLRESAWKLDNEKSDAGVYCAMAK